MMEPEIVYKIRRKTDGLFSSGGSSPSFSKKGKVWRSQSAISLHFSMLVKYSDSYYKRDYLGVYEDCEVIAYEMKEIESKPAFEWADRIRERKEMRKQEREEAHRTWLEENRRKEYLALKAEFEHGLRY